MKAAKYVAKWYPVKESVHDSIIYKQGEEVIIPSETEYVNVDCDSAIKVAKRSQSIKKVIVKVPIVSKRRIDTVYKERTIVKENIAYKQVLGDSILLLNKKNNTLADKNATVITTRNRLWWSSGILLVALLGTWYVNLKNSFKRYT